jgi:hypothetical protein
MTGMRHHLGDDNSVEAPARPLLIFERRTDGKYVVAGRNDQIVLRANDGGVAANGCDPFGEGRIAIKGRYFTVENGVACGAHWIDYVTFRFDPASNGFLFDNWRVQSWSMNPSTDPNAEALVANPPRVVRSGRKKVSFSRWRRPPGG